MLTKTSARALATRVAKESSNVRVKTGRTNGLICLHLAVDKPPTKSHDRIAYSETIYDESEWDLHPENWSNRPRKKDKQQDDPDISAAVANREAI